MSSFEPRNECTLNPLELSQWRGRGLGNHLGLKQLEVMADVGMKTQAALRRMVGLISGVTRSRRARGHVRLLVRGLGVTLATVAIAGVSLIRNAEAEGAEIRASCEAAAKADESTDALYCLGFIAAFRDFEQVSSSVLSQSPDFCIGPDVSEARLAEIFLTYLAVHPEHQNEPARLALRAALEKSHPCL